MRKRFIYPTLQNYFLRRLERYRSKYFVRAIMCLKIENCGTARSFETDKRAFDLHSKFRFHDIRYKYETLPARETIVNHRPGLIWNTAKKRTVTV